MEKRGSDGQVVMGVVLVRVFPGSAYATFAVLSVPGVLFVIAGLKLRGAADDSEVLGSTVGRARQPPLIQ